jgi:hypothetical protein
MSKAKGRPADEPPATVEEVKQAIVALTRADLLRLRKFAYHRHWTLGRRRAGRNPEDLLSDALIAVLEGRRKWIRSRVDFVKLLIGVIQSLSSHISAGRPVDAFDDAVSYDAPDNDTDAVDRRPSPTAPTPEEELEAIELDRRIRDRFQDDEHALTMYQGFCEGMTPAEIRDCGLTVHEFDAGAKRLRRGVTRILERSQP